MSGLLRLLQQKFNPPKDSVPSDAFVGRTVLITGATTGLGLEAAKKVVARGAKKLIITARDAKRGQNAKSALQKAAKEAKSSTQVDVLSLNMSSIESVKVFVEKIRTKYADLDTAILNAGTLQLKWTKSEDGYEEVIQVNTISTVLLGMLLLPVLEQSSTLKQPAHLTFVSSGTVLGVKASDMSYLTGKKVLQAISEEKAWPGPRAQYARSKLLLEYGVRHIAKLPRLNSGKGDLKVIVNSTCPGMCKSDLGRQYKTNILITLAAWILMTFFARTTEQGSRSYVSAVTRGADSQGQLWKDDKYYSNSELGEMIGTAEGDKLGDETWKDLVEVMQKADPGVRSILESE
jgi:NAD(P)-dependent dehydrogenase (short-subunit alcohol dehydrogenase family)